MNYDFSIIKEPLLEWYGQHHRDLPWRQNKNPYYVWISEIMLQQTRVEAVKDYYNRFIMECPDVFSLSKLSEERLMKLWEGLGYYNRARNLKNTADIVVKQYHGVFPKEYDKVLALPGIGEYTAGAICSICYDYETPAVDGNVLRVMTRLSNWYAVIDEQKTKQQAKKLLAGLYSHGDCGLLTQSLMELGATVCVPNGLPKCTSCPLQSQCKALESGTYGELPCRKEKKKRREVDMTVFILHDGDWYGIKKRSGKGLLANMWEFLNVERKMSMKQALKYISDLGYEPVEVEKMISYNHIFTHVKWNMEAYYIRCNNQKEELKWIQKSDFEDIYALPTAFRVFVD